MKKVNKQKADSLKKEYDFDKLEGGVKGKYSKNIIKAAILYY